MKFHIIYILVSSLNFVLKFYKFPKVLKTLTAMLFKLINLLLFITEQDLPSLLQYG